jgi:hypothetical protein
MITSAQDPRKSIIDDVQLTSDTLTARGGLALFARYLRGMDLLPELERVFGSMRRSRKGLPISVLFHQLICFFVDGTSRHLVRFDELKEDAGYAGAIETPQQQMMSSHMVKRFFQAFWGVQCWLFRRVLQQLFLWRIKLQQPGVIVLGIDAMVLDNSEASQREGVQPTYKKSVRGFAPLQITWGPFIIDAVFRGGKKHSNADHTVGQAIRHIVDFVRAHYRPDVAIIIRMDSGFFDQELFALCEDLGIGYVCGGKLYGDLAASVRAAPTERWAGYRNRQQAWQYLDFEDQRGNWRRARRALYLRPVYEDEQCVFEFARPETVLYTNLGCGELIDGLLDAAGHGGWTCASRIIELYHNRGADELVHRALKEFGSEQLPFQRFPANSAYYYTMLVAFFLYECFKQDVAVPVVPVAAYPTRVRRVVIDFAAKLVRTGGKTFLKVTAATWNQLRIPELWERSGNPPRFAWG